MKTANDKNVRLIIAGFLFALLWPSASVTTKIGLQYVQPFVLAVTRFFLAGILLLIFSHIFLKQRLPQRNEWKHLCVYGFLNITIYLGLYVVAMQHISAGLGSLAIATNPVFINIISALWFKKRITVVVIISLLLCFAGVIIAAYPLLVNSYATPYGLLLLITSMFCYSVAAIYFTNTKWNGISVFTINGWQTILGGFFLLPFAYYFFDDSKNVFNIHFVYSVLWLAIPVSIFAVQLWLYLLNDNPVKASFWLFLCPVFGFVMAAVIMKEPVGVLTFAGLLFVIAGLYLSQKTKGVKIIKN